MCTKNHNHDAWFLRCRVRQAKHFVILDHFLSLYPLKNPGDQNFEKMKKATENIIILHMCTEDLNHMMYAF